MVELERKNKNKPWSYVPGAGLNRRYLNSTVYELTGPAAGCALVKTVADPRPRHQGTIGNCAGGTTPWGTMLSGEENFNGYFVSPGTSASDKRYGLTSNATARKWELDDPRLSDADVPGETKYPLKFSSPDRDSSRGVVPPAQLRRPALDGAACGSAAVFATRSEQLQLQFVDRAAQVAAVAPWT